MVAPSERACASSSPAASPPRNSGPPRWRWVIAVEGGEVQVVEGERAVGADAVPGRAVAVGPDRDHRRRGLRGRPCAPARRRRRAPAPAVPAGCRAIGSAPTAPKLRTSRAEPGQHDRSAARGAGGENRIVSTSWPSEPVGDRLDADHVGVEDVHADGGDLHGFCLGGAVVAGRVPCVDHVRLLVLGEHARGARARWRGGAAWPATRAAVRSRPPCRA